MLHVEVTTDPGQHGHMPLLNRIGPDGIIRLCGDSVELRRPVKIDTVADGPRRIRLNFSIPVQSFDSGLYQLPPVAFVAGHDTAYSQPLTLKVIPVAIGENEAISDYFDVENPPRKFFDFVPDFIIDYWALFLAILLLAALFVWGWIRYKKQGSILPPKPQPTPYEVAIRDLNALQRENLWQNGQERKYFTRLTEILRTYLQDRFGINALEMTTRQIMNTLTDNQEVKEKRGYMRQILDMADYVKFARLRPLPDDNVKAYENALRFVEETKPVEADKAEGKEADK